MDWILYGLLLIGGAALYVACGYFPAHLPVFLPWDFSWIVYLSTALALIWYFRGCARLAEPPPWWRTLFYVIGVAAIYAVMQTRYDYWSQHMFFIHRFQHLVLHHLGPFLIALSVPDDALWVGMPEFFRAPLTSRPVRATVDVIQNPFVAPLLFVGLIYLWLAPAIHARVMLDANLYDLMNWSMAIDGIFFWSLILDPRPKPPARLAPFWRALMIIAVVPPQILVGAMLALTQRDIYPVYEICGRLFPISAITDQHYGGLILWIPSSMMSVIGLILVLNFMRLNEENSDVAA